MADHSDLGFVPDDDDLGFVPDAIPGPGHADVAAPKAAAAPADNEYAHPNELASDIQALGEGIGVGPIARRITAAGRTVLPEALGGNDLSYDENLKREEARRTGAATDHPVRYGAFSTAGNYIGATMNPLAYAGLAATNGALETPGGLPEKALGAATGGGEALLFGKLGKAAPRVAGATAASLGLKGAYDTATAGGTTGDVLASIGGATLGGTAAFSGHAGLSKEADHVAKRGAMAESDVRATSQARLDEAGQKIAAAEQAAVKDVDRQRAQTDRQNVARTDAVRSGAVADAQDANRVAQRQAQGKIDARASAADQQLRVRNDARAELTAKRVAEKYARDLSKLNHEDAMARAEADYEIKKVAHDEEMAKHNDLAERAKANARRTVDLAKEKAKLQKAYEAEQQGVEQSVQDLRDLGVDAESVDASIAGKIGEMFRESHTRLDNLIRGQERHGLPVNPRYVALHRKLTEILSKNTPRKIADLEEFLADPAKWKAAEREAMLNAKALDGQGFKRAEGTEPQKDLPPDFDTQAEANVAAREKQKADDQARFDAALAEENQRLGVGDAPAAPAKPDDSDYRQGVRDMLRRKLEAGPTELPPGPDTIARREADRATRAGLRTTQDANRAAATLAGRDDPSLILDKREAIKPSTGSGTPLSEATEAAIRQGREDVRGGMSDAGLEKRDLLEQYLREKHPSLLRRVATAGVSSVPGGAIGGVPGALVGATVGATLARPKESFLHNRYLGRSDSMAGVAPGGVAVERYSKPGAAAAIFRELEPALRGRAAKSKERAGTLARSGLNAGLPASRAALDAALSDPEFLDWLRSKKGRGQ